MSAMKSIVLFLIAITSVQLTSSVSLNDTQCIENPTGEVSLNVAVRGVPGPEGPRGPKGDIGPTGKIGLKGNRGVKGKKGDLGDIGPFGPKGMKGETGKKGQKGALGIQGIQGPDGLPGLEGPIGPRGFPGPDGVRGPRGPAGLHGPRGPRGVPGDTVLNEEEFSRVTNNVHNLVLVNINSTVTTLYKKVEELNNSVLQEVKSRDEGILNAVMMELKVFNETLSLLKYQLPVTKCGIFGNWRRIAYFDTTQGDSCPTGLRTVTNTTTKQTACGRTKTRSGCASVPVPVRFCYRHVCGIVKGYQEGSPDGFGPYVRGDDSTIDMSYVDGVSITQGSPRQHLWTYATGVAEEAPDQRHRCPCARSNPKDTSHIPDFVGDNYYCESGFPANSWRFGAVTWDDPLWDGKNCVNPNNACCERYGWFHRNVPLSSDDIELRICGDQDVADEDTLIESFDFWVM